MTTLMCVYVPSAENGVSSSVHRGTVKTLDGPPQRVEAVTNWLSAAGAAGGAKAAAIGFGVVPKN
jgi:hypothetical protein